MRIKRKCKICNEEFHAIKHTQFFCKRKCFKKDYYQRTKARLIELASRRPTYSCPICDHRSIVDYDPVSNYSTFETFVCPFCGIPRAVMVEHSNDYYFVMGNSMTAQFVVSSAIVSY